MNLGGFDKIIKDAMSLFSNFGALSKANSGQNNMPQMYQNPMIGQQIGNPYNGSPYNGNPYNMGNNQFNGGQYSNLNNPSQNNNRPQDIRPPLPGYNSPNINKRDIKKTNEYYLEKIKNFLNKEY
ncbi:MAG: hypothetical protein PHX62_04640 [Bacilli bacterium]|nr:hypothetical protein [Bacilli bacterium]